MTSPLWLSRRQKWENMFPAWKECENICRCVDVIGKSTSYLLRLPSPACLISPFRNPLYDPLCCWWYNNSVLVAFQWSCSKSKWLTGKTLLIRLHNKTYSVILWQFNNSSPGVFDRIKGSISSYHTHTHTHQHLDHRCFWCVEGIVPCSWTCTSC